MINWLLNTSLKNRLFVCLIGILVMLSGAFLMTNLPIDVLPDLNRPTVTIFLEAHGLSPEEVETQIAFPVESVLNGATGVVRVRSVSSVGLSLIFVEFEWGSDIFIDRQIVAEKLQTITSQLPAGVSPTLAPISSIMGVIMLVGLSSEDSLVSPLELRDLADWTLKPRLLSISGVSQITIIGGSQKQYQIIVKPEKLLAYRISLQEVQDVLEKESVNTSGGFIFDKGQESIIKNIARFTTIDDIKNVVIKEINGIPILLSQIADIKIQGTPFKRGDASINAKPGVILSIQKQPNANTVKLTKKIEAELKNLKSHLPAGVIFHTELFRQSNFIESSIKNVKNALRDAAILVVIILVIFLMNFRTTIITLLSIPLSLCMTVIVFKYFGLSINTMTLGGLAVAIGALVDDSIVGVENVFRRLKENKRKTTPHPIFKVVYDASVEVRDPILIATIIIILVYIPLFAMGGIEGKLFIPFGVSYIVAILASLLVSITVTPVLSYYLLPNAPVMDKPDGFVVRGLKNFVTKHVYTRTLNKPWVPISITAIIFVISMFVLFFFTGREFLPPFNEGSITINLLSPPGTSLMESNRIGTIAENLILEIPEARNVGRRTGRAENDEHAEGVHSTEIELELEESERRREEILNDIREKLNTLPGTVINIGQPISHRIDHLLSGIRAQVAVKLFGEDLRILRLKADEIKEIMESVPGVVDLFVEQQVLVPEIRVEVDRKKAQQFGINGGQVTEILETALAGKVVGQLFRGQKRYEVVLRSPDYVRKDIESLENLLISTPSGIEIPFKMIGTVREAKSPNQILRENTKRRIVIQCNVSGRDLGSVIGDIQKGINEKAHLPEGYFVQYGGQFESQQEATKIILVLSLLPLFGIILLLYTQFKSWNLVLQNLTNIPFSLIGAVIAIHLTGGVASVPSLIAFITLCGLSSRNSILMLGHFLHLMRHEGESFDKKMVMRGASERLIPVLMTATTSGLGFVPLLLAGHEAGKEILFPIAVVSFGGIVVSTLLDIFVTPAIFWKFGKSAAIRIFEEENNTEVVVRLQKEALS